MCAGRETDQIINFNPESTVDSVGKGSSGDGSRKTNETSASEASSQSSGCSPPKQALAQLVITQQPKPATEIATRSSGTRTAQDAGRGEEVA